MSRFRRQVRGLAGRIRQLSRGLSVCRQPSARAEIHSPPGPTGCSLDRAPLPAFPVPGLIENSQSLKSEYSHETSISLPRQLKPIQHRDFTDRKECVASRPPVCLTLEFFYGARPVPKERGLFRGVPVLVPVRASPTPSLAREDGFVNTEFFLFSPPSAAVPPSEAGFPSDTSPLISGAGHGTGVHWHGKKNRPPGLRAQMQSVADWL